VAARRFCQTLGDGLLERFKVFIVGVVETFFAHETPEPLNQIEIGRIGGQKEELDAQLAGPLEHEPAALIARIVQHQGNRGAEAKDGDLLEQFAHADGVDVALIGHGNELVSDGMQSSQHIEALSATRSAHQHASETPEPAQIRPQDEMGRIDEKDGALTGFGLL
jgi:hypothetical protein